MADKNRINSLIADIDALTGDVNSLTPTDAEPKSLAQRLTEATGLETVVIPGYAEDNPYHGAYMAAQAAVKNLVIQPPISEQAGQAISNLDQRSDIL